MHDIVIKSGTIIDGTGAPRFEGDIGISNGKVTQIAKSIDEKGAGRVIDAAGKIVAPGVIDLHTHYDAQIHWDPYCTNSGWHGSTTIGLGNCGFGFAPCRPEDRDRAMQMMETTEQIPRSVLKTALPWSWETFPQWMDNLRAQKRGINVLSFMPINPLMIYVMGIDAAKSRPATKTERAKMRDLLNLAMDAGAIGFAFSYQSEKNGHTDFDGTPMPTDVMDPEDAFLLGDVLRERGEGIIQCLADMPGCSINRGILEELAVRSQRPILHNILQVMDSMPEFHQGVLQFLDDMEAKGHTVYSQAMSMHTWTQFNFVDFNFWDPIGPTFKEFSLAGDRAAKLALVQNADFRERFRAEYDPAKMVGVVGGSLETFRLLKAHSANYKEFEGARLGEVSAATGKNIVDTFFDVFTQSEGAVEVRTTELGCSDAATLAHVINHPRVMYGASDGGAHVKFWSGGQFSTDVITWLGRDEKLISLEEIHRKLSKVPAEFAGLKNRGTLEAGQAADVMVYDLEKLGCNLDSFDTVHDQPDGSYRRVVRAEGIEAILCNGEATFIHNECTGALPGQILTPA